MQVELFYCNKQIFLFLYSTDTHQAGKRCVNSDTFRKKSSLSLFTFTKTTSFH